jgi:hypothetical protein
MATGTIGSLPGVNDWIFDGSMHQAWIQTYAVGAIGRMVQVDSYAAGATGGGSGGAVAWWNGSPVLTLGTWPGLGGGSGTSATWTTTTGDVPFLGADGWEFGFYASNGVWVVYHDDGGSTFVKGSAITNISGGTNVSAYAGRTGSLSSYGTYFIVQHYVKISGTMTKKFVEVKVAGTMKVVKRYVKVGGTMKQVAQFNEAPFDPVHAQPVWHEDENGLLIPGVITWEGPLYLGPPGARELHLHGEKILQPRPYELVTA